MKTLIAIFLLAFSVSSFGQDYYGGGYGGGYGTNYGYQYNAPVPVAPRMPTYGSPFPDISMRAQMERQARQIETMNAIRNYEMIYGDTYRSGR